jgi:preprotein translocase subunit SecA
MQLIMRWKEHLYTIDKIERSVGLRGYAQKDPLIEYKKEAFRAFDILNTVIKSESVEKIMRVQLVAEGAEEAIEKMRPEEPDLRTI